MILCLFRQHNQHKYVQSLRQTLTHRPTQGTANIFCEYEYGRRPPRVGESAFIPLNYSEQRHLVLQRPGARFALYWTPQLQAGS